MTNGHASPGGHLTNGHVSPLHPPRFEVPSETGWDGQQWAAPGQHDDNPDPALDPVAAVDSDAAVDSNTAVDSSTDPPGDPTSDRAVDPESTVRVPPPGSAPRPPMDAPAAAGVSAAEATQVVPPGAGADRAPSAAGGVAGSGDHRVPPDHLAATDDRSGTDAAADGGACAGAGGGVVDPDEEPTRPLGPERVNGRHIPGPLAPAPGGHHGPVPAGPDASRTQRVGVSPAATTGVAGLGGGDPDPTQIVASAGPRPAASSVPGPPTADPARPGPGRAPGYGAVPPSRPAPPASPLPPAPGAGAGAELARVPDSPAALDGGEFGAARRSAVLLEEAMTETARETWPPIDDADLETALAAGAHAHAQAWADPRAPVAAAAEHAALAAVTDTTERAVAVARLGPRHEPGRAPWGRAGLVVPVLGATGGVGASVVAAALFDALDAAGVRTLLVDAADPARSGLASAARNQGAPARTLHPDVGVAFARRGDGWMAQMVTTPGSVVSASMVPAPGWWLPEAEASAPEVTVVDLGWEPWSVAAAPLRGPGAWLEAGAPTPLPVLVAAPTRPGLAAANQLLARLRPWVEVGRVASPVAVAVVGARRWPRDVPGVAARALGPLMDDATFVPADSQTRVAGIGPRPVAARLQRAMAPLLARWDLVPTAARRPGRQHSVGYRGGGGL